MKKLYGAVFIALVAVLLPAALADIKVKTRNTMAGHTSESTVYIKGPRQRSEQSYGPGMSVTTVLQCDQKRQIQINNACKVYLVTPFTEEDEAVEEAAAEPAPPAAKPAAKKGAKTEPASRGGIVTYVNTVTDTGERQQMFGFSARHIKSSMRAEPSPDACLKEKFSMETDGWYANVSYGLSCQTAAQRASARTAAPQKPECQDKIRFRRSGAGQLGYPLKETRTMTAGGQTFTTTTETLELSRSTLEPALFDLPAGYREVTSFQQLMCAPDMGAMMAQATKGDVSEEDMAAAVAAAGASQSTAGKSSGKLRIGVVRIENKAKSSANLQQARELLMNEIRDYDADAVPLDATKPDDIQMEARSKDCDFVLYTDLTRMKAAGKVGGFLGRATGLGTGKYEAQVDYRLFPTGEDTPRLESSASTKEGTMEMEVLGAVFKTEAREAVTEARKGR
ncbi:MAG TPA: hypothetical protein VNK82_04795 [Terriglobales bacterium]|nr:hypothetical protein [Terriglobales bacterium]